METKGLLKSITVWGGIFALLPELVEVVNVVADAGVLPPQVSGVLHAVGGVLAILGRLRAKTTIKGAL